MTTLSSLWPETFPAHKHGKAELSHDAYWTHFASLEHVDPAAIGGADKKDNWITTSMARNQVRSRYQLADLVWSIQPRNVDPSWDGGVKHFLGLLEAYPSMKQNPEWGRYLARWERLVREGLFKQKK